MGNDFIGRLAQDSRARDGQLAHHRIQLALVADRAAEPAILLKMARRVRHHPEDVGIAVLAQDFAGAFARFRSIAIIDAGHGSPWVFWDLLQAALSNGRFHPKQYPAAEAGAK